MNKATERAYAYQASIKIQTVDTGGAALAKYPLKNAVHLYAKACWGLCKSLLVVRKASSVSIDILKTRALLQLRIEIYNLKTLPNRFTRLKVR